jgi:serine kinase of HPr protein (carbohydrate metabolism regulator)
VEGKVDSDDESTISPVIGGLPCGHVLLLTGNTTAGKTQLCLQLAAQAMRMVQKNNVDEDHHDDFNAIRVRYCYSTAGHAGRGLALRFQQLLRNDMLSRRTKQNRSKIKETLKRIEFVPISTTYHLFQILAQLEHEWQLLQQQQDHNQIDHHHHHHKKNQKEVIRMLILDSLPPMLIDRDKTGSWNYVELWLKRLARQYSVWIIVTSATTAVGSSFKVTTSTTKFLKRTTATAFDIHLHLQQQQSQSEKTGLAVQLLRHSSKLVTNKNCCITISPNTI